jgi:hypothetical protein
MGKLPHKLGMADIGERVQFLDENGYDAQLERAREVFTKGQILTVRDIRIGGFESSYEFVGYGKESFNTVMFEPR